MSTISPVSNTSATTAGNTADDVAARTPQKKLGQNDFLKLLATQFKYQDPMKPMEDTAFIAQMAQFSALEQSTALGKDMTMMRADQQRATANSYLGHRVTVATKDGIAAGEVSAVEMYDGEPRLVVGDETFSLSAVLRVEPSLVTAPAPQPTPVGAG